MTDPAITGALSQRKQLETKLAECEAKIKRLRAQLADTNKFIAQWEKFSGQAAPANLRQDETQKDTDGPIGNSSKEDVATMARVILAGAGGPLSRAELYRRLVSSGLRIQGKVPEMVLSTMLWRAGKDAGIVRLKSGGYALAGRTNPQDHEDADEIVDSDQHNPFD